MKKNYFKSLAQVAMLLCVPLFIASCDEFGDEDNPIPSYISMSNSPVTITLKYGVDPTFTRTALATSDAVIEYSSEDESIATVDPKTGVVTGVGEGTTKIFAKATGYSTGGKKIFEEATMEYPVTVKDYRANITYALKDTLLASGSTVNAIVPKAWPATSNVSYSKVEDANNAAAIISGVGPVITLTGKEGKATIKAKITSVPADFEMESFKNADNEVAATFTIEVKEGIVYMDWDAEKAKPVRKVLFKKDAAGQDQYTVLDNDWITEANGATGDDVTLDAGTYYLKATTFLTKNMKLAGYVDFIIADNANFGINNFNLVDATANTHTLNIYGEMGSTGWFWVDGPTTDAAVKDFKEINVYGGNTAANCYSNGGGCINKVGAINVFNGRLKAEVQSWAGVAGYGIKMPEGSKINVSGGLLEAYGAGTNVDNSWAVIGNVEVNKGRFQAECAGNKAVDGTVTATVTKESDDDPTPWNWNAATKTYDGTWATFTGKPTKKYVWAFTDDDE